MRRRTAMAGVLLLAAAAIGIVARRPGATAGDEAASRFLGCVRQVGGDSFSLAVSQVRPDDPLRIETYAMIGSGGIALSDHVEHTIEVFGTLEASDDPFLRLRVSSARHIAGFCWSP